MCISMQYCTRRSGRTCKCVVLRTWTIFIVLVLCARAAHAMDPEKDAPGEIGQASHSRNSLQDEKPGASVRAVRSKGADSVSAGDLLTFLQESHADAAGARSVFGDGNLCADTCCITVVSPVPGFQVIRHKASFCPVSASLPQARIERTPRGFVCVCARARVFRPILGVDQTSLLDQQ